jgi:hypothetical protein
MRSPNRRWPRWNAPAAALSNRRHLFSEGSVGYRPDNPNRSTLRQSAICFPTADFLRCSIPEAQKFCASRFHRALAVAPGFDPIDPRLETASLRSSWIGSGQSRSAKAVRLSGFWWDLGTTDVLPGTEETSL